jgi:hypothetical protein
MVVQLVDLFHRKRQDFEAQRDSKSAERSSPKLRPTRVAGCEHRDGFELGHVSTW